MNSNHIRLKYCCLFVLLITTKSGFAQNRKIDSVIIEMMAKNHIAGLSAATVDSGKITWTGYYGYQNLERKIPVTEQTLFAIASSSKTVTVAALMQLYKQGKFKLGDDINKYLPFKVANPNYPAVPITFSQLLRHRSSIRDNVDYLGQFWFVNKGDPTIPLGYFLKEYLTVGGKNYNAGKNFFTEKPDSAFNYSNIGMALVGYLVERISGMPFDKYCKLNVFTPLEMNTSAWFIKDIDTNKLAMPYDYNDSLKRFVKLGFGGYPDYPAGTLHTTATQFSNFLIAWTQGGRFNNKQVFDKNAIQLITPDETNMGYYTWFLNANAKGELIYNHNGADNGVLSFIAFNPKTKHGIIFMMNGLIASREVFKKLINDIYYIPQ